MRADAYHHQILRPDRAGMVFCVFGGLVLIKLLGLRIDQFVVVPFNALEHFGGATQDPDRLAAPFDNLHVARGDFGQVDLDRCPCRLGFFRRREGADKRHGYSRPAQPAKHGSQSERAALLLAHASRLKTALRRDVRVRLVAVIRI